MKWKRARVIVTGGAGFIGGAIVDRLLTMGSLVTVADNFMMNDEYQLERLKSSRLREIYAAHGQSVNLESIDLYTERSRFKAIASRNDVVFHLAAVFGGREFVDTRQTECSEMLAIDHNVISASYEAGVQNFHYASSACVYPPSINIAGKLLSEEDILSTGEKWRSSDNLYGFGKLMGEMQLKVLNEEHGFRSSSCRYLTVYGPGQFDNSHAIPALIERAVQGQDPFVVWGSGNQERGFTYIDDIVEGSILAAEKIADGSAINLGWDKRYTIREVADLILKVSGHQPARIYYDRKKPEGPLSRALDINRAKEMLDWAPKVSLDDGIRRTIEWHKRTLAAAISVGAHVPSAE